MREAWICLGYMETTKGTKSGEDGLGIVEERDKKDLKWNGAA